MAQKVVIIERFHCALHVMYFYRCLHGRDWVVLHVYWIQSARNLHYTKYNINRYWLKVAYSHRNVLYSIEIWSQKLNDRAPISINDRGSSHAELYNLANPNDRSIVEVRGKKLYIDSGGHENQFEICPPVHQSP